MARGSISTDSQNDRASKRRRVTRACDVCKTKKKACTGDIPCSWCSRHKVTCTYQLAYNRGAPMSPQPSSQTDAPGLAHNDHAHTSSNNNGRLQSESVATIHSSQTPESTQKPPMPTVPSFVIRSEDSVVRDQPILQPSRAVSPGAREMRHIAGQLSGPASAHSFLYRVLEKVHQSKCGANTEPTPDSPSNQSIFAFGDAQFPRVISEPQMHLPDWDMAREYVRFYFEFASPTYKILHQGTVEHWVDKIYQKSSAASQSSQVETASDTSGTVSDATKAIVLMICAIASMYQNGPRHGESTGDQPPPRQSEVFYTMALRLTDGEVGMPSLESIQVRFLLVLYLLSSSRLNKAWFTFGSVVQLLMMLGLHRRAPSIGARTTISNTQTIQHECEKRILWCSFTLDKYLSLMLGRPRLLQEDDIDQEFPSSLNDEDLCWIDELKPKPKPSRDTVMHASIAHARLSIVLGRAAKDLYAITSMSHTKQMATINDLSNQITNWQMQLPLMFSGNIRPNSLVPIFRRQLTVLRLAFFHAMMFVTRPLLLRNYAKYEHNNYTRLYQPHIDACITAAQNTMELVLELVTDDQLFPVFWYTQYIVFNALSVAYLYIIQVKGGRIQTVQTRHHDGSYDSTNAKSYESQLQELAETTFHNLARVTVQNAPHTRYAAILEGLRAEVNANVTISNSPSHPNQEHLPQEASSDEFNWSRFLEFLDPMALGDMQVAGDLEGPTKMSNSFVPEEHPSHHKDAISGYDIDQLPQDPHSWLSSAHDGIGFEFWAQMDSLPVSYPRFQNARNHTADPFMFAPL